MMEVGWRLKAAPSAAGMGAASPGLPTQAKSA
jgi:hypothetical protein